MCAAQSAGDAVILGLEPFEDWLELDAASLAAATAGRYSAVLATDFAAEHGERWAAAGVIGRCWMGRGGGAAGDPTGCMLKSAASQPAFWSWLAERLAAGGVPAGGVPAGSLFAEEEWLPLAGVTDARTKLVEISDLVGLAAVPHPSGCRAIVAQRLTQGVRWGQVLALDCAPSRYPVGIEHDWLADFMRPAQSLRAAAAALAHSEFGGAYVGLHLRTGEELRSCCSPARSSPRCADSLYLAPLIGPALNPGHSVPVDLQDDNAVGIAARQAVLHRTVLKFWWPRPATACRLSHRPGHRRRASGGGCGGGWCQCGVRGGRSAGRLAAGRIRYCLHRRTCGPRWRCCSAGRAAAGDRGAISCQAGHGGAKQGRPLYRALPLLFQPHGRPATAAAARQQHGGLFRRAATGGRARQQWALRRRGRGRASSGDIVLGHGSSLRPGRGARGACRWDVMTESGRHTFVRIPSILWSGAQQRRGPISLFAAGRRRRAGGLCSNAVLYWPDRPLDLGRRVPAQRLRARGSLA